MTHDAMRRSRASTGKATHTALSLRDTATGAMARCHCVTEYDAFGEDRCDYVHLLMHSLALSAYPLCQFCTYIITRF